jgi:hypothetical protein
MNQLVGLRTPIPVVSNRSYPEPDAPVRRCIREFVRTWPNLTETTVTGVLFIEADGPDQIGTAVAQFVRRLRAALQDGLSDQWSCYMSVHEQPSSSNRQSQVVELRSSQAVYPPLLSALLSIPADGIKNAPRISSKSPLTCYFCGRADNGRADSVVGLTVVGLTGFEPATT